MFYNVTVDTAVMRQTAERITAYIRAHKACMNRAGSAVNMIQQENVGQEFTLFQRKWEDANGNASTSQKMLNCLESYANYLRCCANEYEAVQNNARVRVTWI